MEKWVEKIVGEAERLDWTELAITAGEIPNKPEKNSLKVGYLMRLYYRVKRWKNKCEFGQIRLAERDGEPYIMFYNYTFEQYVWADKNNLADWLENNYFLVPKEKLGEESYNKLKERAINNYA